jgi:hypothetical protein
MSAQDDQDGQRNYASGSDCATNPIGCHFFGEYGPGSQGQESAPKPVPREAGQD